MECFAQLVGTVLTLWDAAALDAAGQDGEVSPTFMNLADASIKMVDSFVLSDVLDPRADSPPADRDITHPKSRDATAAERAQHLHCRQK